MQVSARNMADVSGYYTKPEGWNNTRPRYGLALAPDASQGRELRAPTGTRLGGEMLSASYGSDPSALGLNARQIGSFCVSERAEQRPAGWYCVP